MHDYWNDPPETEEPPECPSCGDGYASADCSVVGDKMILVCEDCGHVWHVPYHDYDPPECLLPDEPEISDLFNTVPSHTPE